MAKTRSATKNGAELAGKRPLLNAYLGLYSIVSAVLWAGCLALAVQSMLETGSTTLVYSRASTAVRLTQTLSLLELVHSLMGWVRSPFMTAFLQVLSRIFMVWGPAHVLATAQSQTHWAYALMICAWSVTEVIRYTYYAALVCGSGAPAWLLWLRYNTFLVLYPAGITGELLQIAKVLPAAAPLGAKLAAQLGVPTAVGSASLYWAVIAAALVYVPGAPIMYSHMLRQRRKHAVSGGSKRPTRAGKSRRD